MSYDKYRNWPLPGKSMMPRVQDHKTIEEQVLEDLASTDDEIEKLEILDSYSAYIQRSYRKDLAVKSAIAAAHAIGDLLEPSLLSKLPDAFIPHRPRVVQK